MLQEVPDDLKARTEAEGEARSCAATVKAEGVEGIGLAILCAA